MSGSRTSTFAVGVLLAITLTAAGATPAAAQPAVQGEWSPVFKTPNVMIHTHVLPTGKVLFWGRREAGEDLNPHKCTPRIWDPKKGTGAGAFSETKNTPGYNLFCSSHTFLADGRLFVAGGHLFDGQGEAHVTIYNPTDDSWTKLGDLPDMSGGRWYPTVVTLADGGVLVSFGSNAQGPNTTQQVWKDGAWRDLSTASFINAPYYPRMHFVPDGRVFMSGPLRLTQFLDTSGKGQWTPFSNRVDPLVTKEYAPSVLYSETPEDAGKVLFIGGGNGPTNSVEMLDLNAKDPKWTAADSMQFKRRQHNATLLPDGTILVTGGTQGTGAKYEKEEKGFNDLRIGSPIRSAELWNPNKPAGQHWTKMAKADVDRCYHSTAVLLPDATVLSAGGGEYSPPNDQGRTENLPEDTHKDAQIFSPPYLFQPNGMRAERPDITDAPGDVKYGDAFAVKTTHPDQIGRVSWVRLSSVTHSFNTNQRINVLKFTADAAGLKVTAPADPKVCPPGHYMLFVLNKTGVPSVAKIIRIHP
jgi:galactose oxidase